VEPGANEPIDLDASRVEMRHPTRPERPTGRVLAIGALAFAALLGTFTLGRAASPTAAELPVAPVPAPTSEPTATVAPAPTPVPSPAVVDLLGEGSVVAEINFGSRSRVAIWCRETVPGTSIGSTLAMLHFGESLEFGEQLIRYEELTKPWIPQSGRRGVVLETEGLGAGNFAQASDDDDPIVLGASDGSRCESCTPELTEIGGDEMLVGSCVHGVPLRVGIVYVIARPIRPGQTPLALHASCGITTIRAQSDTLLIEAEAPLLRGLHDARFPLPPVTLVREAGWLRADDLQLFDWNCDVEQSTQLEGQHVLRTEPERRLSFTRTDSLIGEIGFRGPMAIGLDPSQCSQLTRAWWDRSGEKRGTGRPIADLVGIDPPAGETDWYYTCQPQ